MSEKIEDILNSVLEDGDEGYQDIEEEIIRETVRIYQKRLILV